MSKIVFVSGRLGGGGSERVVALLANQMQKHGNEVWIISFGSAEKTYDIECQTLIINYRNTIDQILKLRSRICAMAPDTVIAFEYHIGMKTVLATRGMNVKVIISERSDPHAIDNKPLKKRLRNYCYCRADLIVCQTDDVAAYFSSEIRAKSLVIYNPVKEHLPRWDAQNHRKIIVNFCRLERVKNLPLLINAFEPIHHQVPEYKLEIYGDGNEKETLQKLIKMKGMDDCVSILPFTDKIHDLLSQCSIYVSTSDFEGLSNSMLEAMAMGMPVICTDCPVGGAKMMINRYRNGILIPVNDKEKLCEAMMATVDSLEKESLCYAQADRVRSDLSLEKITKKWMAVME